jgi:prolyl-tRNA synthetase
MRQSHLFTKTKKEVPAEEVSINAKLLIQAGFIHKEMAGVYTMLPLGLRVLNKIANIIREEHTTVGCQELQMTALQDPELWKKTDRWDKDKVDAWFRTELSSGAELGLGLTHEEPLVNILKQYVSSYRDLPKYIYQIQTKFRNELRAKSGILRGREFLMKDLYSFNKTEEDREKFYDLMKEVYMRIFSRVGLGDVTFPTFASGGIFSEFSHEFQTLCDAGEDIIYVHEEKKIAINKEVLTEKVLKMLEVKQDELVERKAIEVGNIFPLGTKYAETLGLVYSDEEGNEKPVVMGSYGIGLGRLMGAIVEVHNDEFGIVWPQSVAPFDVHLVSLSRSESEIARIDDVYEKLLKLGVDVLYDDRTEARAGDKFASSDLIGIPERVVISPKTLEKNEVEVKNRSTSEVSMVAIEKYIN